jgi:hypothetical protein
MIDMIENNETMQGIKVRHSDGYPTRTRHRLHEAKMRVLELLRHTAVDPQGMALGAYMNSILGSARITALEELAIQPSGEGGGAEAFDAMLLKVLERMAKAIEKEIEESRLRPCGPSAKETLHVAKQRRQAPRAGSCGAYSSSRSLSR